MHTQILSTKTKKDIPTEETDKGVPLAPSKKDLNPWYSARDADRDKDVDKGRR